MSKYYVKFNELNNQADSLQNIGRTFSTFESRLNSIANSMDVRDSTMATLRTQIRNCGKSLPQLYNNISSGSKTLSEASRLYRAAEKEQYDNFSEIQTKQKEDNWFNDLLKDGFWDGIADTGFLGSAGALIGKPIASWLSNGKISGDGLGPEFFVGSVKDGFKAVEELYKLNPNLLNIRRFQDLKLIGDIATNVLDPTAAWATRLQDVFKDSLSDSYKGFTEGGADAVFAWGGVVIAGASAGISNYKDYKAGDITVERAVEGTIVQTIIEVGKDIVIGAAATAVVGAAIGSAPILAVAAVTVVLSVGLDSASNLLTGKSFTKASSDFILDTKDNVVDLVDNMNEKLQENFKSAVNCSRNVIGESIANWELSGLFGK